jgi:cytochrome P450
VTTSTGSKDNQLNLFDPAFTADPHPAYRRVRSGCPVAREPFTGAAILTRFEDVLYALRHPEIFSSGMEATVLGNERPLIPLQIDPPEQTRYRKILDPRFSRKQVLALEDDVRKLAGSLIDGFAGQRECEFNRDFAIPFPCTVFLRLMGLPLDHLERFLELKDGIIRPSAGNPDEAARVRAETGKRIYAYFEEVIDDRSRNRRDDLMSYFLDAEVDGRKLTTEEILDICFLFLLGGLDTVTSSLGCSLAYLSQHPEQRERLVEDPALIPSAIEELLRHETPVVAVTRVLKQDVSLGGVELRAGDPVRLCLGAADADPDEFPHPDSVDLARERNRHLAFGGGAHRCLGSHLARMELRIALEELHRRIPDYELKPGETPRYSLGIREVTYLPLIFSGAPA